MIASTKQLLACVIKHHKALIHAIRSDLTSSCINTGELVSVLCSIGIEPPRHSHFGNPRTANLVTNEKEIIPTEQEDTDLYDLLGNDLDNSNSLDSLLHLAYQILKKRQRPLPKQYFFPMSSKDTKLGKPPPSPCKVCGGPKHWDRECPYWDQYIEKMRKKTAQIVALQIREDASPEEAYHAAYQALALDMAGQSENKNKESSDQESLGFHKASHKDSEAEKPRVPESKSINLAIIEPMETENKQVTLSDIGDEEESHMGAVLHLSFNYILEPFMDEEEDPKESESEVALAPPRELKPMHLTSCHKTKEGESAAGIPVLAVEGWVGSLCNKKTYVRHDSCTNISLVSKEFYKTLKDAPAIRTGMKLNLWQLTDKNTKLWGFI